MKASGSQHSSPATSSSSSQETREQSDPGDHSPSHPASHPAASAANGGHGNGSSGGSDGDGSGEGRGGIAIATEAEQHLVSISQPECSSPTAYTGLPELTPVRPLILHHPHMVEGVGPPGDENSMSWLYDFYPNVLGSSSKDELYVEQSSGEHHLEQQSDFGQDHHPTLFKAQEKYVVTLGAPISIAQRMDDHTLTYLNKGQFYGVSVMGNTHMSLPQQVKTVLALTFFDELDRRSEFNHWQYWYSLQANPNQRAFDIDRKNCENVLGKLDDLAYNAASFMWTPEVGVKIVLRINCLSTEFSSQKGVKGIPLFLVADTYEDLDTETAEPIHRAVCRIKIFRDKGAERKNKDETKSVERRMLKFMKEQSGGALESEGGVSTLFHPPSKETVLTSTSSLGPKMFLFVPQQQDYPAMKVDRRSSDFLQNIKERETKRTFSRALKQAKEGFGALEVEVEEDTPPKKARPRIPDKLTTVYVRKEEESIYNALLLDSLTVHEFKLQISKKYNVPADMIKEVLKKTSKGLLVHFDEDMISHFKDEDDFIINLTFDNQKGCFNLLIHY